MSFCHESIGAFLLPAAFFGAEQNWSAITVRTAMVNRIVFFIKLFGLFLFCYTVSIAGALGFSLYSFGPGLLSVQYSTKSQIPPTSGIKPISKNQPLFPTSCKRRTET